MIGDLNGDHIDSERRNYIVNQISTIDAAAGKFISAWSIVSFGSVSLLLPFVSNAIINGYITDYFFLWRLSLILFLTASITSLLWLLIRAVGESVSMEANAKKPNYRDDDRVWILLYRLKWMQRISLIAAVVSLPSAFVCIFIFLLSNGMI